MATKTATQECAALHELGNWTLYCERGNHVKPLARGDDAAFHNTHSAWYKGVEYEWGGFPDDKALRQVEPGYRTPDNDETRVGDLCARDLFKRVSITAGVTTFAGLLISIKHYPVEMSPVKSSSKIRLKMGTDERSIELEDHTKLKLYKNV